MELNDVQAMHFYKLRTGQIARVTGIEGHWVQCEIYDHALRDWIQSPTLLPPQSFLEQCSDPSLE